jgi:hypothetical protein
MLVIAMPVPSNAIIPTLPTAPLWPPPTTMPATICGTVRDDRKDDASNHKDG